MKKTLLLALAFCFTTGLHAQMDEGLWQGYDGEWSHVSKQLVALAEATPQDKFAWRPAPGIRSTSEVYMHIAMANFYLLSVTGPKMPADMERKVTVFGRSATVDGMYLRILIHDNEHMGQLIAYARMTGVVPPWTKAEGESPKPPAKPSGI